MCYHFKIQNISDERVLFAKGVFPYEYFNSFDKFEETCLPPKDAFYSSLKKKLDCKTLKDYHDHCLKTDVLFLADVFENFRKVGMNNNGLDPAQYYTLPGYSWDVCLKHTHVELSLLRDPGIHLFSKTRFSAAFLSSTRLARANTSSVPGFDADKHKFFLAIFDANNLYGWAVSKRLPTKDFKCMDEAEVRG